MDTLEKIDRSKKKNNQIEKLIEEFNKLCSYILKAEKIDEYTIEFNRENPNGKIVIFAEYQEGQLQIFEHNPINIFRINDIVKLCKKIYKIEEKEYTRLYGER